MSSRELFFQEMCWLNMPLYFLHFLGRPFNYLIFLMKVFKLFWGKTSWKWKWLCILIRNQTRKLYFSITKNLSKKLFTCLSYMTVSSNFHKKGCRTLLFIFLEWSLLQSFQVSWLFSSMSTIFLIQSISLYSIYCYRFK